MHMVDLLSIFTCATAESKIIFLPLACMNGHETCSSILQIKCRFCIIMMSAAILYRSHCSFSVYISLVVTGYYNNVYQLHGN